MKLLIALFFYLFTGFFVQSQDLSLLKKEAERLGAKYILDEGPDGPLSVSDPMKVISKDFKTVILYRQFDLIA